MMKASRRIERLRNVQGDSKVKKVVQPLPLEEIQALKNNAKRNTTGTPRKLRTNWKKVKAYNQNQTKTKVKPVEPTDAEKLQDVLYEASYMADEQNCSARRIQTAVRGSRARAILRGMLMNKAAIKVQSSFRAYRAQRDFRRSASATKIQTVWRGVIPQRQRTVAVKNVITLQAWWRMVPVHDFFLRYMAARLIQTMWRRFSTRTKYISDQKDRKAVTKIQAAWRCHKLRTDFIVDLFDVLMIQSFTRMRIARKKYLRRLHATRIQRVARGFIARRAYALEQDRRLTNHSAREIQRVFRGQQTRTRVTTYKFIIKAAVTIQSWWRRYDAQCEVWYALGCAIEIQCLARTTAARKFLKVSLTSVNVIQRAVRCYHAQKLLKQHLAARSIQTAWRYFDAHQDYLDWKDANEAATLMQSAWRRFVCYTDYTFVRADAITIQRYVRGHAGRKQFDIIHTARDEERAHELLRHQCATHIQRIFRGTVGRSQSDVMFQHALENECATVIQSKWRSHREQEIFIYTLGSVLIIQGCARGYIQRHFFARDNRRIVLAQSICRRWRARQVCYQRQLLNAALIGAYKRQQVERLAAKTLQSWYRKSVETAIINAAATQVQSFFRMVRAMVDFSIDISIKRKEEKGKKKKRRKKRVGTGIKYSDSIGDASPLVSILNPIHDPRFRPSGCISQSLSQPESESTNSVGRLLGLDSDSASEENSIASKRNVAEGMLPVSTRFLTSPHRRSSPARKGKLLSRGRACKGKSIELPVPKIKKSFDSTHREVSSGVVPSTSKRAHSIDTDPSKNLSKVSPTVPSRMLQAKASTDPSKCVMKSSPFARTSFMYLEDEQIPAPTNRHKHMDSSSICSQSTGVVRIGSRIVPEYDDISAMSSLSASYDELSVEFSVHSRDPLCSAKSRASSNGSGQENVAPIRRDTVREAPLKKLCRPNRAKGAVDALRASIMKKGSRARSRSPKTLGLTMAPAVA